MCCQHIYCYSFTPRLARITKLFLILRTQAILLCAAGTFLIEHFYPWIQKIMNAYQEQKEFDDLFIPKSKYFKANYTKKVNEKKE